MKYNIHWVEIRNLEVDAISKDEAMSIWAVQAYDESEVSRDYPNKPTITVLTKQKV